MTNYFSGGYNVGAGIRYTLAGGDSLFVGQAGFVGSTDSTAVSTTDGDIFVSIAGTVAGFDGISIGNDLTDSIGQVMVTSSGVVSGSSSAITGVASSFYLDNAGTITADSTAIYIGLASSGRIINTGTIAGDGGISVSSGDGALTVLNWGMIESQSSFYALFLGAGFDHVENGGTIAGAVDLGDGNDTFITRGAGMVTSTVYGGAGNDVFYAGAAGETFDGGIGTDRVMLGNGGGPVALDLSFGAGTGVADGDAYFSVEQFVGSVHADVLKGDNTGQQLNGGYGNDLMVGMGGVDWLVGGAGNDSLAGGAGNDAFLFARPDEGVDTITDFANAAGNNDAFRVSAAGFGGGLVAGALAASQFRVGATNAAGDANDRFIYRTTDHTLWFDADGTGAGGAQLLATILNGTMLSAADIVIY